MKRHFALSRLLAGLAASIMVLAANISTAMAYEKEIKSISSSIAESVTSAGKKTVAVVDFTDLQGNVTGAMLQNSAGSLPRRFQLI